MPGWQEEQVEYVHISMKQIQVHSYKNNGLSQGDTKYRSITVSQDTWKMKYTWETAGVFSESTGLTHQVLTCCLVYSVYCFVLKKN